LQKYEVEEESQGKQAANEGATGAKAAEYDS
jgi:hypothetical protein